VEDDGGKFANKSKEEVIEMYSNLESSYGKHSGEVGELRKELSSMKETLSKNEKPKSQQDLITESKTDDLRNQIDYLESQIGKKDAAIEDDNYSENVVLLNKLNREYMGRMQDERYGSDKATTANQKHLDDFAKEYDELTKSEMDSVMQEAQGRFADKYGEITKNDLEAALFRTQPEKFKKYMQASAADKERKRIAGAKAKEQPRMSASGKSTSKGYTNLNKIAKERPWELGKIMENLTDADLDALQKRINK